MRSRFELDGGGEMNEGAPLLSAAHEPAEASEPATARFVVEEDECDEPSPSSPPASENGLSATAEPLQPSLIDSETSDSWRNEVADRLNRYRARRRPRAPRYPSLTLKFEASEPRSSSRYAAETPSVHQALAMDSVPLVDETEAATTFTNSVPVFAGLPETAKVLEFPRSLTLPSRPLDELADPVFDRPRILEVPEVAPLPPALGGILIEPTEQVEEKRPGFEIPLQPARLSRRLGAAAIDALLVLMACALFAYVFFRVTSIVPPMPLAIETVVLLSAVLWAGFQYSALIFTGTTPGLRVAKLQLRRFDGAPVPRRVRRWRMLASLLSAVSLGLGYAWCFLDEDQLCWHDRITRTYMAPK
jgi:uncharacterized RDD family membrane protein YckC